MSEIHQFPTKDAPKTKDAPRVGGAAEAELLEMRLDRALMALNTAWRGVVAPTVYRSCIKICALYGINPKCMVTTWCDPCGPHLLPNNGVPIGPAEFIQPAWVQFIPYVCAVELEDSKNG